MELLTLDCLGQPLRLEASTAGWQALFWNNQRVSELQADGPHYQHQFQLQTEEKVIHCRIEVELL